MLWREFLALCLVLTWTSFQASADDDVQVIEEAREAAAQAIESGELDADIILLALPVESPSEPLIVEVIAEPPPAELLAEDDPHPRDTKHIGLDFVVALDGSLLLDGGVGLELRVTIIAPVTLDIASISNAVTYTFSADANLNILPLFMKAKFTPFLAVGYRQTRFTGLIDEAVEAFFPELGESGIGLTFEGTTLHRLEAHAGFDWLADTGFHMQVGLGRSMQVGSSQGQDAFTGIQFKDWQSWIAFVQIGKVY